MKAQKRPIEMIAFKYNNLEDTVEFIKKTSNEKYRIDSLTKSIFILKNVGEMELKFNNWLLYDHTNDNQLWAIDEKIFLSTYQCINADENLYVKKRIINDCEHFNQLSKEHILKMLNFINITDVNQKMIDDIIDHKRIIIKTLEGYEKVNYGDYIIKGVKNEVYPIRQSVFKKIYMMI